MYVSFGKYHVLHRPDPCTLRFTDKTIIFHPRHEIPLWGGQHVVFPKEIQGIATEMYFSFEKYHVLHRPHSRGIRFTYKTMIFHPLMKSLSGEVRL